MSKFSGILSFTVIMLVFLIDIVAIYFEAKILATLLTAILLLSSFMLGILFKSDH